MMPDHEQFLIVHPDGSRTRRRNSGALLEDVAQRLFVASEEISLEVALRASGEVGDMAAERLSGLTLMVVDPLACASAAGNRSLFFRKLTAAHRRIMVSAGPVSSARYKRQLRLPVTFDAVFDVGFVEQSEAHPEPNVLYHFVFDGPTAREAEIIRARSPEKRRIPWVMIVSETPSHLELLTHLIDHADSRGIVRLHRPVGGSSSPAPEELLSRTDYYVWGSDSSSAYYESTRFVEAILAGAVPCKIDSDLSQRGSNIPGIFPSVESFCAQFREEGPWSLYRLARDFYLSKGSLGEHLRGALRHV
jgi:hypothetical protein